MLSKATTLKGYTLNSLDGEIGKVKEFYFDDQHWTIRYLVADYGYYGWPMYWGGPIAKDTGSMQRLPRSLPVERNTRKGFM